MSEEPFAAGHRSLEEDMSWRDLRPPKDLIHSAHGFGAIYIPPLAYALQVESKPRKFDVRPASDSIPASSPQGNMAMKWTFRMVPMYSYHIL
jgi:hypothetical protein